MKIDQIIGITASVLICLCLFFTPIRSAAPDTARPVLLCLSAHPDDEDGVALVYCKNVLHASTYSVFFTRGEGGQNETGSELSADLGELRTRETLAASAILGSKIYFLGFPDFGYSKTARETFVRWGGRDSVLARVVYIIRALQPDVILTNHDTITTPPLRQHGNHQVVGLTAYDAFRLAAEPGFHPEQFQQPGIRPWQVKKLFFRARDTSHAVQIVSLDGSLRDSTGESYASIAFRALAEHRSQGMDKLNRDSIPPRFLRHDYLLIRSDENYPFGKSDLFSGLTAAPRKEPAILSAADMPVSPLSIKMENSSFAFDFPRLSGQRSDEREITVHIHNALQEECAGFLSLSHAQDTILRRTINLHPGETTERLTVSLPVPKSDQPVALTLTAEVHDRSGRPMLVSAPITIVPVHLDRPDHVSIGLIRSYDRTTEDVLKEFHIPHTLLDSAMIAVGNLHFYTSIVLDLRAYASRPDAVRYNSRLLEYVRQGGNLICLYHKPGDWNGKQFAPYPLLITGERVTEEDAPVNILSPGHPYFSTPNRITGHDWNNWVQERNIYLPSDDTNKTSSNYTRLLAMSDEGEHQPPTSILTCRYGSGSYTYVSLALYRQMKAANEGALKLFCNLLAPHGPR